MTPKMVIFLLLLAIFYPCLARADMPNSLEACIPNPLVVNMPNPPDVSGWKTEAIYGIDVRLSPLAVIYLGFETLYSNPNDSNEFAFVTRIHPPLILATPNPRDERMFNGVVLVIRDQDEFKTILRKYYDKSDVVVYQRWRAVKDARTGQPIRTGNIEVWFLDAGGNCNFVTDQKVSTAPVSELRSPDFKDGILAGIRYSIGDKYQITRAAHIFLVMAMKEGQ